MDKTINVKQSHGGRRKGAGRKRLGKHLVGFMLTPEVTKRLQKQRKQAAQLEANSSKKRLLRSLGRNPEPSLG